MIFHLILITIISLPHEEFSVTDFTYFTHFNICVCSFSNWTNNLALFHLIWGYDWISIRYSHLLGLLSCICLNFVILLFLRIWFIIQVALETSHFMHAAITCSWSAKVTVVLWLLRNLFRACNAVIGNNFCTNRFSQFKYIVFTIKVNNLGPNIYFILIIFDLLSLNKFLNVAIISGCYFTIITNSHELTIRVVGILTSLIIVFLPWLLHIWTTQISLIINIRSS